MVKLSEHYLVKLLIQIIVIGIAVFLVAICTDWDQRVAFHYIDEYFQTSN